jgi:hypothetical protein
MKERYGNVVILLLTRFGVEHEHVQLPPVDLFVRNRFLHDGRVLRRDLSD